jgi:pyrimidine operon attenuation protein/uracil phosphoribosyltransferase
VANHVLHDAAGIAAALASIADKIAERNGKDLALVGIRTGGLHLAERLVKLLEGKTGARPPLGALDIALYRDDVFEGRPRPEVGPTELPFSLPGKTIVLVDDVLYTGRTVRAALSELMDYGRPRAVQLAVLIDRGHRELPIQPDFVGMIVPTTREQAVRVHLREAGAAQDAVELRQKS